MDNTAREKLQEKYYRNLKRQLTKVQGLDVIDSKKLSKYATRIFIFILVGIFFMCLDFNKAAQLFIDLGETVFSWYTGIVNLFVS